MIGGRSQTPVKGSVHWLLAAILLWEVVELLRRSGTATLWGWPLGFFDLFFLLAVPLLLAMAFIRLFVAVIQSGYGSLNAYTVTSSPWAWLFWTGLVLTIVGHGEHVGAHLLNQTVPEVVRNGEFGAMVRFFDESLGPWVAGAGLFLMTSVIIVLGQGSAQRVIGGERFLLILGSLVTFGAGILYVGVEGRLLIPAILAAWGLVAVAFRHLAAWEVSHDPVSLFVVPGAAAAGSILFAWGLLVGGQPTWPW